MGFLSTIKKKKRYAFIGGAVAGLILPPILKSKTIHKAAVCVTAKGMGIKDGAVATYETIKEDAQDVYAEARKKAAEGDAPSE